MSTIRLPIRPILYSPVYSSSGSRSAKSQKFDPHYDADPSEADIPSNRAYPRGRSALDAVSVSAGAEYSLDGVNWTSVAGVWGTNKFIMVRGPAHADFNSAIIHTVYFNEGEIDEVSIDFTIWTRVNPNVGFPYTFPFELG